MLLAKSAMIQQSTSSGLLHQHRRRRSRLTDGSGENCVLGKTKENSQLAHLGALLVLLRLADTGSPRTSLTDAQGVFRPLLQAPCGGAPNRIQIWTASGRHRCNAFYVPARFRSFSACSSFLRRSCSDCSSSRSLCFSSSLSCQEHQNNAKFRASDR